MIYSRGMGGGSIVDENSVPTSYSIAFLPSFFFLDKTNETVIDFPLKVSQCVFFLWNELAMLPYLTELYKD